MEEIKLIGKVVKLRPLTLEDTPALYQAAQDKRIWVHTTDVLSTEQDVRRYIERTLNAKQTGTEYPFVIVHRETNQLIGSTRFLDISLAHKRLEIGSTWLNPAFWRSPVNTECKYLLLTYCFEQLQLNRVQLKTGHENLRSQQAIERLGAKKEGILRNHMIQPNGSIRHTVMYSITLEEWPEVKANLQQLIEKYEA